MDAKDRNKMHITGRPPRRKPSSTGRSSKEPEIEIHYTPAKPFNRNRFLLRLATVAAIVLALVFGMSIFFKTGQVTVTGAQKYTPWEIQQASGIRSGDALLSLSEAKISAKIRTKLPYVGDVRVGIKLPDTVNIEITELAVVYAVADNAGAWWLMDATGRIVDQTDVTAAKDYTQIIGVQITSAVIGEQAVAYEPAVPTDGATETAPSVPTLPKTPAAEYLNAAVQILGVLEHNGIMGTVDSVNVANLQGFSMEYDGRYQVSLGDISRMDYKISAMKAAIEKMGDYQSGYLDVSFTIWPDEVGYRPFDES